MRQDLPEQLPNHMLKANWLNMRDFKSEWYDKIVAEGQRCSDGPGWNPKIVPLEGSLVMIDVCFTSGLKHLDMIHSIKVADYVDHPFLAELPSNAPRAVKSLYRKEVRMKHLRLTDAFPFFDDVRSAERAWSNFLSVAAPH